MAMPMPNDGLKGLAPTAERPGLHAGGDIVFTDPQNWEVLQDWRADDPPRPIWAAGCC